MSRICSVTNTQPRDAGSDSTNTGLTALPKACENGFQRCWIHVSLDGAARVPHATAWWTLAVVP